MKSEQLRQVRIACRLKLLDALYKLVRENGEDYNDYFRNEHGIEADEGCTIVKVYDIACFGCHMALPLRWCDGLTADVHPLNSELEDEFGYHAYWSLYIERNKEGDETLMLYQFFCSGVYWDSDDAEPDHSPATDLSLAELDYLTQAISWHLMEVEQNKKKEYVNKTNYEQKRMKYKVTIIFGEYAAKAYMSDGVLGIVKHLDEGLLLVREFDTEAERNAYIKGIDDSDGWLCAAVLSKRDAECETIKKLLEE